MAAAIAVSLPAGAQNAAAPAPGCEGIAFEDPAGDQIVNFVPHSGTPGPPVPGKPNMDIRAGWLSYTTDAAGKSILTANIQVTDLGFETEGGAFGLIYNFQWTDDEGASRYVQAQVVGGNAAFEFGTAGADGYTSEGSTTGKLHPGPNGVISMVVPRGAAPAGKTLTATNANAANAYGSSAGAYFFPQSDAAPDDGQGKDYKVGPCGGAAPAPAQQQPQQAQQASRFDATASPTSLKARKVRKASKVTFTVNAGEELKGAKFSLRKGRKVLGSATAATFNKGKVTVRLARKGLRKGAYALVVSGTRANGSQASDSIAIRVR
jgi:hypothetical protein